MPKLSPVTILTVTPHFLNLSTDSGIPGLKGSFIPVMQINI